MSNTSHILGLDENDLFYGKIQMALVLVRMVIALSLPGESTSSRAKMDRSLRSCSQTGWREGRQVGAEDGVGEILKRGRCPKWTR